MRRSSTATAICAIAPKEYRQMKRWGLPNWIFIMLAVLNSLGYPTVRDVDCLDMFSGMQRVAGAFRSAGYLALSYEIGDGTDLQIMCSGNGFIKALAWTRRMRAGAMGMWGILGCAVLGNLQPTAVRQASTLVSRCILLLLVSAARQCLYLIERPGIIVMMQYPRFCMPALRALLDQSFSWTEAYGTDTAKATRLSSSVAYFYNFFRPLPDHLRATTQEGEEDECHIYIYINIYTFIYIYIYIQIYI